VVYQHLTTLKGDLRPGSTDKGFRLHCRIRLDDVTYSYPNTSTSAVSNINLTIEAKQSVAFVGKSGAGKSTLVDLILGLLNPESGEILIDDCPLDEVKAAWQGQIGYVPQHIYLSDDTVARNIAFGVDKKEIDQDAIVRAAEIADIHNHIVTRLNDGYDTLIGERGIRLSGGQRQRIGIARAMYRKPSILVLDEATSALDGATENVVMDAIQRLSNDITIVLIAHRTTTVQFCERIFVLSDGRIVDEGDYTKLTVESPAFRALSNLPDFRSIEGSDE
jgi:ABC-type multidrug transport system fused ATPase/permease subunit